MKKFELVFIPIMAAGHLASAVELANIIVSRDPRLCITMIVHSISTQQVESISTRVADKPISIVVLPEQPPLKHDINRHYLMKTLDIVEYYKPSVLEAVSNIKRPIVGFVVDLFCITMVDVANQFQVPCYGYYTSGAGSLSAILALPQIYDGNNGSYDVLKHTQFALSGFINPLPPNVFPSIFIEDQVADWFRDAANKVRSELKGVLINTFVELEPNVLDSFTTNDSVSKLPSMFPIGPILNFKNSASSDDDGAEILKWLDNQPRASVIFLCFGSMGSFGKEQVWEIARGLEQSGVRFVWSLRKKPTGGGSYDPSDYDDIGEDLPNGFLQRTAGTGKVIGWAPQVEILNHSAVGGFVTHCGWNSTFESLWHGVPIITWPMYAEQQLNAFEMAVELGLAVDLVLVNDVAKLVLIKAEEIERAIRRLMEDGGELKKKVEAKREESRACLMEGGSSFNFLGRFIDELFANARTED